MPKQQFAVMMKDELKIKEQVLNVFKQPLILAPVLLFLSL